MHVDYIGLGKRIRHARKRLHYTQELLSRKIGISVSFLGHIERGSRKASIETLLALAVELNTSIDMLLIDSRSLEIGVNIEENTYNQLKDTLTIGFDELNESLDVLSKSMAKTRACPTRRRICQTKNSSEIRQIAEDYANKREDS